MKRRTLIKTGTAILGASLLPNTALWAASTRKDLCKLSDTLPLAAGNNSYWLGADFWSNRLQDWRQIDNRIVCTRSGKSDEVSNLILSGDQHLAMLKQLGIDEFDDGPVQFCGPAGGTFWQRWFEAGGQLDNPRNDDPNTGNFTDAFGNKVRILAVANPKITYKEYLKHVKTGMKFMSDPALKSEGYGLIKIHHDQQQFEIECWPWHADPEHDQQFAGWPFTVPFRSANKS